MNRKSRYNLKIDFSKSKNSYLFDKNSNNFYLDFFGQYATLAIGYNDPIFKTEEFHYEMSRVSKQKIVNNEILSDETKEFDYYFKKYTSLNCFDYYHYCCTGSLAIESAIKTSIDYKNVKNPRILTFKGSFHGINSYGGIVSDRFNPVNERLDGFPGQYWEPIDNPIIQYSNNTAIVDKNKIDEVIQTIKKTIQNNKNICCIIIEPIQCTFGDRYFPKEFFTLIRSICDSYDIPLIFDEIQTGFCATGKIWYYEHLNIVPDILVFGKKTQLSGIMVNEKFSNIFKKPIRLEVTWDADVVYMVRCKYIIKSFKKNNVIENVNKKGKFFLEELKKIPEIINIRSSGLLFAFDFDTEKKRDCFVDKLFKNKMICNPTRNRTIRMRPNLLVTQEEINEAVSKISDSI